MGGNKETSKTTWRGKGSLKNLVAAGCNFSLLLERTSELNRHESASGLVNTETNLRDSQTPGPASLPPKEGSQREESGSPIWASVSKPSCFQGVISILNGFF